MVKLLEFMTLQRLNLLSALQAHHTCDKFPERDKEHLLLAPATATEENNDNEFDY